MLEIVYKASFIRQFDRLEPALQDEVIEGIKDIKDSNNHRTRKVHKLHGPLKDYYAFSINYRYRIIFQYETKTRITLIEVGDHSIYK